MNTRLQLLTLALLIVCTAPSVAGEAEFLGFTAPVPERWEAEPPENRMRLLQFNIPGDQAEDADMVLYYFGPGRGGSVTENIARWRSQFTDVGGDTLEPRVTEFEVSGMPVTLVELAGTYSRNVGLGPTDEGVPDQTLLAAIIETGQGSVFAQMYGPTATVDAARNGFDDFITGITPVEAPEHEEQEKQSGTGG